MQPCEEAAFAEGQRLNHAKTARERGRDRFVDAEVGDSLVELPGIKANELDITATGNNLAIAGERKILVENENAKYHRKEREAGKFNRMISLPGHIDSEKIKAKLVNGILTITMPKAEEDKPKKVTIN